ncbi:TIGR03545 family protein [Bowmanella dokdonensis]|uniref:TIGR03545 family protein n=1 Tax=Bowmanella dokdonensis TaxID=751969 RepID=A0A939DQ11_9ALTE|nr:TIGR03545 family protein [Bowmanella dokdonensis]MBN7826553.1 TIGR03545 family protein [Bowmanella dokdonensis]
MGRFIRFSGLATFLLILAGLAAIFLLFLNTWIKLAVEIGAGSANGAEVNVGQVSHTLSPLSVTLEQIQLTDPTNPDQNRLFIARLSGGIDLLPLLMDKLIIPELSASGIRFDAPRDSAGDVYAKPTERMKNLFQMPEDSELPGVEEILAKSPLKTDKAVEQARETYARYQQQISEQYQSLPGEETLNDYKQRLDSLQNTEFKDAAALAKAREEFEQLQAQLREDKGALKQFKGSVEEARAALEQQIIQLKAAPQRDYDLLKGLLVGDAAALGEVTQALFGEKVRIWSERLFAAYHVMAPMLARTQQNQTEQRRSEGRFVPFAETRPLPSLLIGKAELSLDWQGQTLSSQWQDITTEHDKLGRATRFSLSSQSSPLWQSLSTTGDFWLGKEGLKANQDWELTGIQLAQQTLLGEGKLTSSLERGQLDSAGTLSIERNQLSGQGRINLSQLELSAKGSNRLTNLLADTLRKLQELKIEADVDGLLDAPNVSLRSDLDRKLGKVLAENVSGEAKARLEELSQKLNARADKALGTQNSNLQQLINWQKVAEGNLDSIEQMLNSQFKNVLDRQKDKLKDKLKDKVFGN